MDTVPLWALFLMLAIYISMLAYLSTLDMSIQTLTDSKVRKLAEEGDTDAVHMLHTEDIDSKLSMALTFAKNVLFIVGGSFVIFPLSIRLLSLVVDLFNVSKTLEIILEILLFIIFIIVVGLIVSIFGIIIPIYVFSLKHTEKNTKMLRKSAIGLYKALKPIVWFLAKFSGNTAALLGKNDEQPASDVTENEILMMVDAGEENGTIESNEKELIENVFNFSTTTASSVMTHRINVVAIRLSDTEEEILNTINNTGKSRFPVYDENIDHISGILYTRDYLLNLRSYNPKPIAELLRPAYLVPESVPTNVLFKNMQTKNTHIAIVVDEYGGTAGLITMEDLLEELVGNIYDEFDKETENNDIVKLEENVWRVAGNVDMETLASELGITVSDDEEYETLGGLVFSQLSSIPNDGAHPEIVVDGLYIYVESLLNRRIEWARVSLIMGPDPLEKQED